MMPEERDRQLVEEAFRRTHEPPAPDLVPRVRRRIRRERLRAGESRGPLAWCIAGGSAVVLLLAGLLVDSGYLDLPIDARPQPAPANSALVHRSPGDADVEPTFLLAPAGGPAGAAPLRRLDWSGRTIGFLAPPAAGGAEVVSPDGSLVAIPDVEGRGATVLDAAGRRVGHMAAFGAWSGDGAHAACALVVDGTSTRVELTDLAARPAPAQHVATVTGAGTPDGRWTLWGCSVRADALVALRLERDGRGPYVVAETARVKLSTGRVLAHEDGGDLAAVAPVLSHDARYLAENDDGGRTAAIRDLDSGEVVGHVAGTVVAFSGDDQLVLTDTGAPGSGPTSRAALVDWRWDRTIWSAAGTAQPLAVRPGGRDLVVSLTGSSGSSRTLLVAAGSGRVIDLDPPAPGALEA